MCVCVTSSKFIYFLVRMFEVTLNQPKTVALLSFKVPRIRGLQILMLLSCCCWRSKKQSQEMNSNMPINYILEEYIYIYPYIHICISICIFKYIYIYVLIISIIHDKQDNSNIMQHIELLNHIHLSFPQIYDPQLFGPTSPVEAALQWLFSGCSPRSSLGQC